MLVLNEIKYIDFKSEVSTAILYSDVAIFDNIFRIFVY